MYIHMCMCRCMYVRSNPFGGATQCMEPYRYIVGNHAPPQMQGRLLGPPAQQRRGSVLPIAAAERPDSCDAAADACMSSTGTAQHRIASQAVDIRGPYHTRRGASSATRGSDQRHARTDAINNKAGRRIMDCSQLAPASHFLSFPCMRIKKGSTLTRR